MNILNKSEQEMFDNPPVVNSSKRQRFFNFPNSLKEKTKTLQKLSTRVRFLLARDYFKAAKKFFKPEDFHQNDIAHVAHRLNLESKKFTLRDKKEQEVAESYNRLIKNAIIC